MSSDKLQGVREALADVFNEANLDATGTVTTQASFDHTLSEAFNETHPNSAKTEQSFTRFDDSALTGLFSELRNERPSPTSFDQAFAEMLSERSALTSDTHSPRPGFDHHAFAEMLNEPAPISTNTTPSQPSFDHQALAEMLTESRADPIDPPATSPLSFNRDQLSSSASNLGKHEEQVAKGLIAASPSGVEGARPPIAKSLLAKLHHLFSTGEQPSLPVVEKDPSPQLFDDQSSNPAAIEVGFAKQLQGNSTHSADSPLSDRPSFSLEGEPTSPRISGEPVDGRRSASEEINAVTRPLHASSVPSEDASPIPIDTKTSPATSEKYSSTPKAGYLFDDVDREAEAAAVNAPSGGAGSAQEQQARSLMIEPEALVSNNTEPVLPIFGEVRSDPILPGSPDDENVKLAERPDEVWKSKARPSPLIFSMPTGSPGSKTTSSQPILSGDLDSLAQAERIVSAALLSEAENPLSQLPELAPPVSAGTESPLHSETEPSSETSFGPSKDMTYAASPFAPSPSTNVDNARPQRSARLLAELTPTISTDPTAPLATAEASPIPLPGERDGPGPAIDRVAPIPPGHATVELSRSLPLADLPAVSTNARSSSPTYQHNALPYRPFRRPESVEPPVKSFVAVPSEPENGLPQHGSPLLTASHVLSTKPSPSLQERAPSALALAAKQDSAKTPAEPIALPTDSESALAHPPSTMVRAVGVASSTDADGVVTRARQAKSALDELDLSTAIQLRWTMRDIRGNRTKLSPVSNNHLTVLMNMGLVEMRDGQPRLTGLGVLSLD